MLASSQHSDDGGRTWTHMDHFGGFAVAPSNGNLIYGMVSREDETSWVEVKVSSDRGQSFDTRGSFGHTTNWIWFQGTSEIAVDSSDSNVLYAVLSEDTADGWFRRLYKSVDGAQTWQQLTGPEEPILAVASDPAKGGVVLVLAENGLYRSDDGGTSWERILSLSASWEDIVLHPAGTGKMWAATSNELRVSTNQGVTWSEIRCPTNISFVSPVFNREGEMYIGDRQSVYFTEDGGQLWDPVPLPEVVAPLSCIAVDPVNPHRMYVGMGAGAGR